MSVLSTIFAVFLILLSMFFFTRAMIISMKGTLHQIQKRSPVAEIPRFKVFMYLVLGLFGLLSALGIFSGNITAEFLVCMLFASIFAGVVYSFGSLQASRKFGETFGEKQRDD